MFGELEKLFLKVPPVPRVHWLVARRVRRRGLATQWSVLSECVVAFRLIRRTDCAARLRTVPDRQIPPDAHRHASYLLSCDSFLDRSSEITPEVLTSFDFTAGL